MVFLHANDGSMNYDTRKCLISNDQIVFIIIVYFISFFSFEDLILDLFFNKLKNNFLTIFIINLKFTKYRSISPKKANFFQKFIV